MNHSFSCQAPPPPNLPLPISAGPGCNGKCPKLSWVWRLYLGHSLSSPHNWKPISSCSLQWPSASKISCVQFHNSYLTMNGKSHSPLKNLTSSWNIFSCSLYSWYDRMCRVQLWFIFWHYRLFSSPDPLFYSHYALSICWIWYTEHSEL